MRRRRRDDRIDRGLAAGARRADRRVSGQKTEVTPDAGFVDALGTLEGATVKLKNEAAQLLNDTFGTDALEGGLVIGVAKITVDTA